MVSERKICEEQPQFRGLLDFQHFWFIIYVSEKCHGI